MVGTIYNAMPSVFTHLIREIPQEQIRTAVSRLLPIGTIHKQHSPFTFTKWIDKWKGNKEDKDRSSVRAERKRIRKCKHN